jgi:hypothetical protein
MTEAQLEHQILDYLAMLRLKAWPTHDARHRPVCPGVPDIMCIRDGFLYAIECKVGKAQPTVEQQTFIGELRAAGATCIIARELADVERYL